MQRSVHSYGQGRKAARWGWRNIPPPAPGNITAPALLSLRSIRPARFRLLHSRAWGQHHQHLLLVSRGGGAAGARHQDLLGPADEHHLPLGIRRERLHLLQPLARLPPTPPSPVSFTGQGLQGKAGSRSSLSWLAHLIAYWGTGILRTEKWQGR